MTLLDYPDHVAAVLFTQGCNFRCFYCHNPLFVDTALFSSPGGSKIPFSAVESFLESRSGFLDGVVISGGEPTLHKPLEDTIRRIKGLGYRVKLDTNGSYPKVLKKLIEQNLLDYVAMDYKCLPGDYMENCGFEMPLEIFQQSVNILKTSEVPYEFRTTVWQEYHTLECLRKMGTLIAGAQSWALQNIRTGEVLGDCSHATPFNPARLEKFKDPLSDFSKEVNVR